MFLFILLIVRLVLQADSAHNKQGHESAGVKDILLNESQQEEISQEHGHKKKGHGSQNAAVKDIENANILNDHKKHDEDEEHSDSADSSKLRSKKKNKKKQTLMEPGEDIPSIGLDHKKVVAFGLRPSRKGRCRRDSVIKCGSICRCIKGKRYCCRQRKDWDTLRQWEKQLLLQTVFDISTGRLGWRIRNEYNDHIYVHERYWFDRIHHKLEFYPWHRIYLLKLENILRKVDCRITIPFWDWTKNPSRWFQSNIFSAHGVGSNFNPTTGRYASDAMCPTNGFFSEFSGFLDAHNVCLVRQFSYNIYPASYRRIQNILSWTDFTSFENALRHEHGIPHYIVGGEGAGIFFTSRAAEDPLFWLHHSNVDYQWYQRQTRYTDMAYQFWGEKPQRNYQLTGYYEKVKHAVNPFNQGMGRENTCVEYVENDRRYEELLAEMAAGEEVGSLHAECRKRQHRFPDSIFTLFRTTRDEIVDFLQHRNEDGYC